MATTTTTNPTTNSSFGFASPKVSTSKTATSTCNICKRLLYSFEEILICQSCHGPYHWRCVKPETVSHYGENRHFICDLCSDSLTSTSTTTNTSHRISSSGLKTKPSEVSERDYQDYLTAPSKVNTIPTKDTTNVQNNRYYEDNQQQQRPQHPSGYKISQQGDYSENFSTPINDPISTDADRPLSSSHYGGSLRYITGDYEPPKSNIRLSPLNNSTSLISSNADNFPTYGRPQHFISTTNLNVNPTLSRPQQQQNTYKNSLNYSSPYLSQVRDEDGSTYRVLYQQNPPDYNSNVGSDSGIVLTQPTCPHHGKEENQVMEKKLTDLVQKLEHQLETDTKSISDKLDTKLKNLENMINQQTFIIQEQDQVIERLKTKITKIETERDHFRDRLDAHEQPDTQDHKRTAPDPQEGISALVMPRKTSTTSSNVTDYSKKSSKKAPAPRIDHHGPTVYNDNESVVAKLISSVPFNSDRRLSNSSNPSTATILALSVPLIETPAATNRLDSMIRQSTSSDTNDPGALYCNVDGNRNNPYEEYPEDSPTLKQETTRSFNRDDDGYRNMQTSPMKSNLSPTGSMTSSTSTSARTTTQNTTTDKNQGLSTKNPTVHQSLEQLPHRTSQQDDRLNKAVSMELNPRPVVSNEPVTAYSTPEIGTYPAAQYPNVTKGLLRKRNPDSFFKRIDPFYFVLTNDQLLMFKRDMDRTPYKRINLAGATLTPNEDQKHGRFLLLNWLPPNRKNKRYQLFASNPQEADKWQQAIQTAIANVGESTRT